jgi:hypothetical protein
MNFRVPVPVDNNGSGLQTDAAHSGLGEYGGRRSMVTRTIQAGTHSLRGGSLTGRDLGKATHFWT